MSANSHPGAGAVRQALANHEFIHVYQPIFDLHDGTVHEVESLIRWQHPERGLLTPLHFLDEIHQQGLSAELTESTLANVAADFPALDDFYGPGLRVGVNLSSAQLGDERTLGLFDDAIERGAIDPQRIVVEVVEDLRSEHMALSEQTILGLRERSIRVVLDDFGTGAGTLSLLTDLTYDGLKIDRHFVSRVRHAGPARSVVEVMLTFARENDVVVVAEGVEDEWILRELRDMGCRFAQGYHLGRPATLDQLTNPTPDPVEPAPVAGDSRPDLDAWRQQLEHRIPLLPNIDEASLISLVEQVEGELAGLAPEAALEAFVDLGFRKMLAALYGGCNALAINWGVNTSRYAEEHGMLGRSATILSVVAGITPDPTLDHPPSAEALARAVTIRLSSELTQEERVTVDNNLGVTLLSYGLVEQARTWWESALSHREDCRSWPLAALHLAETSLDRLTSAPWSPRGGSADLDRQTLDAALPVLRDSSFTPQGIADAIEARYAMLDGEIDRAQQILDDAPVDLDAVSGFHVRTARTLFAEASGANQLFLDLSADLLKSVQDNHGLRFQAVRARWIRVRALASNGLHEEAFELQQTMILDEQRHGAGHLASFVEWMRFVVDIDRRYSELADLTAPTSAD